MKITANTLVQHRYMRITDRGFEYCETAIRAHVERFPYIAIDSIIVSPSHDITIQVGENVFTLPYKPQHPKHQAFISALLERVRATLPANGN
jgi:hypothetical protein